MPSPLPLLRAAGTAFLANQSGTAPPPVALPGGTEQFATTAGGPVELYYNDYNTYSGGRRRYDYPSYSDPDGSGSSSGSPSSYAGGRRRYTWDSDNNGYNSPSDGFKYDGSYGADAYAPWSMYGAQVWSSSAERFYRAVMRPCESKQWWQANNYNWGEDDYTLSTSGGSNQDSRLSDTKQCLKKQMAGGYLNGAWVKLMGVDGEKWMQIGRTQIHFSQDSCTVVLGNYGRNFNTQKTRKNILSLCRYTDKSENHHVRIHECVLQFILQKYVYL